MEYNVANWYRTKHQATQKAIELWLELRNNQSLVKESISCSSKPSHWQFRIFFNYSLKDYPLVGGISVSALKLIVAEPPVIETLLIDWKGSFIYDENLGYQNCRHFNNSQELVQEILRVQKA